MHLGKKNGVCQYSCFYMSHTTAFAEVEGIQKPIIMH